MTSQIIYMIVLPDGSGNAPLPLAAPPSPRPSPPPSPPPRPKTVRPRKTLAQKRLKTERDLYLVQQRIKRSKKRRDDANVAYNNALNRKVELSIRLQELEEEETYENTQKTKEMLTRDVFAVFRHIIYVSAKEFCGPQYLCDHCNSERLRVFFKYKKKMPFIRCLNCLNFGPYSQFSGVDEQTQEDMKNDPSHWNQILRDIQKQTENGFHHMVNSLFRVAHSRWKKKGARKHQPSAWSQKQVGSLLRHPFTRRHQTLQRKIEIEENEDKLKRHVEKYLSLLRSWVEVYNHIYPNRKYDECLWVMYCFSDLVE